VASSDSMAWVTQAKHERALPGCPHKRCGSCLQWALRWREDLLGAVAQTHPGLATHGAPRAREPGSEQWWADGTHREKRRVGTPPTRCLTAHRPTNGNCPRPDVRQPPS
jgi:hypothetical protein